MALTHNTHHTHTHHTPGIYRMFCWDCRADQPYTMDVYEGEKILDVRNPEYVFVHQTHRIIDAIRAEKRRGSQCDPVVALYDINNQVLIDFSWYRVPRNVMAKMAWLA